MRAPLSIVIPTLNASADLGPTLAALGEGLQAGLLREVIFSDGGGDARIAMVAEAAGAILVQGPPGRGGQLARGAAAAKGEWLLFLHADTWLAEGWAKAVAAHMQGFPDHAGWFRLRFRAKGAAPRIVAAWANLRSRLGLPYGDQGLLIRHDLYRRVGGYPEIALMEDVALARRLRGRLRALAGTALTDAVRYERAGWLRQSLRNGWRLVRFLAGVPAERLARGYREGR